MIRRLILLLCTCLLCACNARGTLVPPQPPTPTSASPITPGILLRGQVRLQNGTALANVNICRNYASYPGTLVAVTDSKGSYQTAFAAIPGDEMVGVWALHAGYNFVPATVRWRHYYGYEERTIDFVAVPTLATEVPPAGCQ